MLNKLTEFLLFRFWWSLYATSTWSANKVSQLQFYWIVLDSELSERMMSFYSTVATDMLW